MTQMLTAPQTLTVDYEELMARAEEIEAPVPGLPTDNPLPPCLVAMALSATEQLGLSADNMRTYLRTGIEREWPKLAENIRKAAEAYEQVDENAAAAIDNGTSMAGVTSCAGQDLDSVVLTDTQVATAVSFEYEDLIQRAWDVENGDKGASFENFAEAWTAYRQTLLSAVDRFRPFDNYDGDAAYAIEQEMDKQRQWLVAMADSCLTMINQARTVAETQRWAYTGPTINSGSYAGAHTYIEFEEFGEPGTGRIWGMFDYATLRSWEEWYPTLSPDNQEDLLVAFADVQQKSDWVMAEYARRAALPLPPINPQKPPYVQAAPDSNTDDGIPSDPTYPTNPTEPTSGRPYDDLNGANPGSRESALSSLASQDASGDPASTDQPAYAPLPTTTSSAGAGVKPASFGGGGMPATC